MRLPTSLLSRTRAGITLLLGLLMASVPAAAQQGSGTIRGTVIDPQGNVTAVRSGPEEEEAIEDLVTRAMARRPL